MQKTGNATSSLFEYHVCNRIYYFKTLFPTCNLYLINLLIIYSWYNFKMLALLICCGFMTLYNKSTVLYWCYALHISRFCRTDSVLNLSFSICNCCIVNFLNSGWYPFKYNIQFVFHTGGCNRMKSFFHDCLSKDPFFDKLNQMHQLASSNNAGFNGVPIRRQMHIYELKIISREITPENIFSTFDIYFDY